MKDLIKNKRTTSSILILPDGFYRINSIVAGEIPIIVNTGETAVSLAEVYTDEHQDQFTRATLEKASYVPVQLEQQMELSDFPRTILVTLTPWAYDFSMQFFGKITKKIGRVALVVRQQVFVLEAFNMPDANRQYRLCVQTDSGYEILCELLPFLMEPTLTATEKSKIAS